MKDTVAGLELFAIANYYGKYLVCDSCGKTLDAPRVNVGTEQERIGSSAEDLFTLAEELGWEINENYHLCGGCK